MKKSQILAALALAFALGVVAPVAGAQTSVYALNATEEADTNAINTKLDKIYSGLGTLTIYDANKLEYQKVGPDALAYYRADNNYIISAQNTVKNTKAATVSTAGSAAATLRTAIAGALDSDSDGSIDTAVLGVSSDMADFFTDSVWATTGTFNDIKGIANSILAKLNAKINSLKNAQDPTDQATRNTLEAYRDDLKRVIDGADTTLADAITTATATDRTNIAAVYLELTGETITINNETELNNAIAKIEGKLPKLAYYRRVAQSIDNLTTMKKHIEDYSHREVEAQLELADKAMAGTITTVTPIEKPTEDPSKNDVNAPASGILGSAEGSATTISIVAGLTTALTALGAGVVAYRNARREK